MKSYGYVRKSDQYFATIEDPEEFAGAVLEKIRTWRQFCNSSGLMSLWRKKLRNYYGVSWSGGSSHGVLAGGSEGENAMIKVNDLRSLLQGQLVIVTGNRPAGKARAINSDSQALKSARIASALAEYYLAEEAFESNFITAAEIGLVLDESFVDIVWDKDAGDPIAVDPQTQKPEMSGDVYLRTHCSWNVSRDPSANVLNQKWHILSYKINKFDAAAIYPRFQDEIIKNENDDLLEIPMNFIMEGSDEIYAHLLVHDRTPAVPSGRYSIIIAGKTVLDTELPYKLYPVDRYSPSDVIEGPTGYAASNDILALEEVSDALNSIVTTNTTKFGGTNIIAPTGNNLNVADIAKGGRLFEVPPDMVDKVKDLMLGRTQPEVFNYLQILDHKKEQAVGSNSIVRGQPEGQLSGASGSAMALIQAQAISFNSGAQRSWFRLLSSTMTKVIFTLATYADTPRVAKIVGKIKAQGLPAFRYTGKDLQSISSIVYEMVNPISQTTGGRITAAQDLLKAGMCKNPKQYIEVYETGTLEPLIQDDENDQFLILEENEWLTEGRPGVRAIITQNHEFHIKSHSSTLTLEAMNSDPGLYERVLGHIQEHITIWQQASMQNPAILIATGQNPLPPPPPPPGMMPPQGMAPPGMHGAPPMPPGGHQSPHLPGNQMSDTDSPVMNKAQEVKNPSLPNVAGQPPGTKPVIPGVTQ